MRKGVLTVNFTFCSQKENFSGQLFNGGNSQDSQLLYYSSCRSRKTTLSDRLLERTQTVVQREMKDQLLDSMDLERERGITIKCHPVSMNYLAKDGKEYFFNLIDTPGHVDFSYEVSRSLAACEGALLLIDASQGVEAQTLANAQLADSQGLEIIPVINKVDLPSADIERVSRQIEEILAIPAEDAIQASGKSGIGVDEILEAIVNRLPGPRWTEHPKSESTCL